MIGNSNDETNSSHRLLLTNAKVLMLCQAFANNSSANIKYSKTQLHKIGQQGEFLDRPLVLLLKTGLPLMKNVLKPLAKSVLIQKPRSCQDIKRKNVLFSNCALCNSMK